MIKRLVLFVKYYLYWVVFFMVQKPLFMLLQHNRLGEIGIGDVFLVIWHGLPLDLSTAAYASALMGLLLVVSFWVSWEPIHRITYAYTGIMTTLGVLVFMADNGCFPAWGYHIDKSVFTFLLSPREVLACADGAVWLVGLLTFALVAVVVVAIFCRLIQKARIEDISPRLTLKNFGQTLLMLIVTGLLFLPMRGSLTVSTMNTGRVYFSANHMLNIAAVNPIFNLVESLSENRLDSKRYHYMSSEEASTLFSEIRPDEGQTEENLFTTQRPNVILMILESFSANAWKAMPCLQNEANEGIHFTRMYANSYRTDRGMMAILGAFPGTSASSVMTIPSLTGRLPQVGQVMKEAGYDLKFYYGGDEDFTNMRSYLVTGGFEKRVSDKSFPINERMSKWGVPDEELFYTAARDIVARQGKDRTFNVVLSLSSHEPFDVPCHRYDNPYLNAVAYTDSCLGQFMKRLRASEMWDSTIVVMMADHGYGYPENITAFDTLHYRIPMVISGGAVRAHREITTLCSQIDWVPTLLHQLGMDASAFVFAKDILSSRPPYAYYHFVDGFALLTKEGTTIIDAKVNAPIVETTASPERAQKARAITQSIMQVLNE